jgi:hypothetical protein
MVVRLIIIIMGLALSGCVPMKDVPAYATTCAALASSDVPLNDTLGVLPHVGKPDALELETVEQVDPPCASSVRATLMGLVQLADGRVFERNPDRTFALRTTSGPFGEDEYDTRTPLQKSLPRITGIKPLSSVRVSARPVGGDFVGLWQVDGKWLVQSFSMLADQSITAPRSVLTSSLPLRSVMYFPAPDTPSGRLEVLQEQPNGSVRSLAFSWWHGAAFEHP